MSGNRLIKIKLGKKSKVVLISGLGDDLHGSRALNIYTY